MKVRGALFRPLLITLAIAMSLASAGFAQTMSVDPGPDATAVPSARKILPNIPNDLVPAYETLWKCACDSDGCWPGCFTLASASVLKYWSQKAYPNLWPYRGVEDENNGLIRLRELFPNLLCFGNGNGNGQPGDSGYDAFDVATGLRQWTVEHGYRFVITNGGGGADGAVEVGGRWLCQKWGSHTGGTPDNDYNNRGIGICLVGDWSARLPTSAQLASLRKLVIYLARTYHISLRDVIGHRDAPGAKTACPGDAFHKYLHGPLKADLAREWP